MTERTWRSSVELRLTGGQAAVEQALAALQACFGSALVVTRGSGAQIGGPEWEVEAHLDITLPEGADDAVSFWREIAAAGEAPLPESTAEAAVPPPASPPGLGVAPCSAQTSE